MRRIILCLTAAFCLTPVLRAAEESKVFVSSAGGNDASSGQSADAPVATLERGLGIARGMPGTRIIVLRAGTYALQKPLILDASDSHLRFESVSGENVIISGGQPVGPWHKAQLNSHECWVTDVADVKNGKWFFREMWMNGKRAVRARQPNASKYSRVKDSPDATGNWEQGQTRFRFSENDVPPGPFARGAEAIVMSRWIESRLPLTQVDVAQRIASFSRRSQFRMEPGDPYWLEGDSRWLDEPGEFFLDRPSGRLYYLPRAGEEIASAQATAPVLSTLIELRGSPAKGRFVEDVTFRGITFSHTQWSQPDPTPPSTQPISGGFSQAAVPVPAAVFGQGVRQCAFENCTFQNLGTWGLELSSARDCRIARCTFKDLGAGGIKLGDGGIAKDPSEQSSGNSITDNEIADAGHVYPSAVGIWVGQAFDNQIAHNDIHDLYYSGISVGWTWGYGESLNRGNVIEHNRIHHIGQRAGADGPILADMGAIYLLGGRSGTVVRNNVLHDVKGLRLAWGIYLDEGCSEVRVENNLVYRTTQGSFHLHYGRENVIKNNIFAFGRDLQIWRSREEAHKSFNFENNIVYWKTGPLTNTGPANVAFDHNLYGPIAEPEFRAGNLNLQQWRAAGQDVNSIVADPLFVDPSQDDFTLRAESPATKIGFKPFDVKSAGRRK